MLPLLHWRNQHMSRVGLHAEESDRCSAGMFSRCPRPTGYHGGLSCTGLATPHEVDYLVHGSMSWAPRSACLQDCHAMGGQAGTALAIAVVPHASQGIMEETLFQMLAGALSTLGPAGCTLVGGHSCEGPELSLGATPAEHVSGCQLMFCCGRCILARASLAPAAGR